VRPLTLDRADLGTFILQAADTFNQPNLVIGSINGLFPEELFRINS